MNATRQSKWARLLLLLLPCVALVLGIAAAFRLVRHSTSTASDVPTLVALYGRTMGSSYSVRYLAPIPPDSQRQPPAPDEVQAAVQRVLAEINNRWSNWQSDSELSRFNAARSTEWISVAPETADLLQQSQSWTELSQGRFDLTIAPLVNLWGFGPRGRAPHLPTEEALEAARARVGISKLQIRRTPPSLRKLDPELELDLSACAAGYAADRVSATLSGLGLDHHYVDIAGEITVRGSRTDRQGWQVGIEHPAGERKLLRTVELHDESIATSGNYRNVYSLDGTTVVHTLDASTGRPVTHQTISVTVIDPSCGRADALATLLMTLPTADALQLANQQGWTVLLVESREGEYHQHASSQFHQRFGPSTDMRDPHKSLQ